MIDYCTRSNLFIFPPKNGRGRMIEII